MVMLLMRYQKRLPRDMILEIEQLWSEHQLVTLSEQLIASMRDGLNPGTQDPDQATSVLNP